MKAKEMAESLLAELISESEGIAARGVGAFIADQEGWRKLLAKGSILIRMLGNGDPSWAIVFRVGRLHRGRDFYEVSGTLQAIHELLLGGYLASFEERVAMDIFGDLQAHAVALQKEGHDLACCVVLRAILEERLRKLCMSRGCLPSRPRPGIEDFNQALYANGKADAAHDYNKATLLWVTSIAVVGNDAAHNLRPIISEDSERMSREVTSFLAKFSP